MKQKINKLAIWLALNILVLPLTACTFNFYANSATRSIINAFANETSSILKALILAKEKNADNSQTIQDILQKFSNSSINNNNSKFKTWEEFSQVWGFKQKINTNDSFKTNEYFVGTGEGSLTKSVNSYRNINNVLDQAAFLQTLSVANNKIFYDLFSQDNVKSSVINFLTEMTKKSSEISPDLKEIITVLKNTFFGFDEEKPDKDYFSNAMIEYLTSFFNYLTDNKWNEDQTTPSDINELKKFMNNWQDKTKQPYSEWTKGESWALGPSYYEHWNPKSFNFYRSGTLINYLFYKIGKDNQIKNPQSSNYEDRYLGGILSDHISPLSESKIINYEELLADLKQYLNVLLKNPSYFVLIAEAILPIIKKIGLQVSDITKGVKYLTFGKKYPTDDKNNSYNMFDILNNINELLNNPVALKTIISKLLNLNDEEENNPSPESAWAYDIKISKFIIFNFPLPYVLKTYVPLQDQQKMLYAITNFLISEPVKAAVNNILNIYQKLIIQYDNQNQGINLDLTQLKDFLLNQTNGLITSINRDIVQFLYEIINDRKDIDEATYWKFYQSLGGQTPSSGNDPVPEFQPNSVLATLKANASNINHPLGQILYLLFGNNSENKKGLFTFIIESNNQWIEDNYTSYFDINNQKLGQVFNATMTATKENNMISDILTYNFNYKINNHNYSFSVKCKSLNQVDDFTGIKNFYFTDIILLNSEKDN